MGSFYDIVVDMEKKRPLLSETQRRVCELILAEKEWATRASIQELARRAETSEPTVIRFCRRLGCSGLRELKLRLAQSLGTGTSFAPAAFAKAGNVDRIVTQVLQDTRDGLSHMEKLFDRGALAQAVDIIGEARRIDCYGVPPASGLVAMDAQARFFRLDLQAYVFVSAHEQMAAAATLKAQDVVFAVSHSGRTPAVVEAVQIARSRQARIVGLTRSGSPLARMSDALLAIDIPENMDPHVGGIPRLAQMTVVDMLACLLAARSLPETWENLRRLKRALAAQRIGTLDSFS